MKPDQLRRRLDSWVGELHQPELHDALEMNELIDLANHLINFIGDSAAEELPSPRVDEGELIAPHVAVRSVVQLVEDLAESLARSYSIQNFVSTSLFLFWSCDELWRIFGCEIDDLRCWGATLLRNYVVTALLAQR
jgi:hypothetical protein